MNYPLKDYLPSAKHLFFLIFRLQTEHKSRRRRHQPRALALVIPFPFLRHTAAVVPSHSALDSNEELRAAAAVAA